MKIGYCDDCEYAASKGEPVFSDCPKCRREGEAVSDNKEQAAAFGLHLLAESFRQEKDEDIAGSVIYQINKERRGHQMGDCAGDKCPDWITRQVAIITDALTTARKEAREAACAKVEAAVWLATKDFKGILNEVQRRAIALATATYVEAAANVEEGAGN